MIVTPENPGSSGWLGISGESKKFMRLEKVLNVDYLVVGAGFSGLSAAWQILRSQPDARVSILEAVDIADGPAGRSSGLMISMPQDISRENSNLSVSALKAELARNQNAIQFAKNARAQYNMPQGAVLPIGSIQAFIGAKRLKNIDNYVQLFEKLDLPYEKMEGEYIRRVTGMEIYEFGIFSPDTCLVQPATYIQELAAGLEREGVSIFANSPVLSFHKAGDHWVFVTKKGRVISPKVILAVNGMIQRFGFFQDQLVHSFNYSALTKPINNLMGDSDWAVTPGGNFGTLIRRVSGSDSSSRIMVSNQCTYNPDMHFTDAQLEESRAELRKAFEKRFDKYKNVELEYVWGGRICFSRNAVPAFGEISPGLYSACCQNGLGSTKGTYSGLMAAQLAMGEKTPELTAFLTLDPPKKLASKPFRNWNAKRLMKKRQKFSHAE